MNAPITAADLLALAEACDRYGDIWAMIAVLSLKDMQTGRKFENAEIAADMYSRADAFRSRAQAIEGLAASVVLDRGVK